MNFYRIKLKVSSFKSSDDINENGNVPYSGFGYLILVSDPLNAEKIARKNTVIL